MVPRNSGGGSYGIFLKLKNSSFGIGQVSAVESLTNRTALHYAVELGNTQIVEDLLNANINYNQIDKNKKTAFMLALETEKTEVLQSFFRGNNFDVNKRDDSIGMPPLLWAIQKRLSVNTIEEILMTGKSSLAVSDRKRNDIDSYISDFGTRDIEKLLSILRQKRTTYL